MGKYTVTEISCHAEYGCLAEYEVHLYVNGDICNNYNMMTIKSDIENIKDVTWPTINVDMAGVNERDIVNKIAIITGRRSGKTQYGLELLRACESYRFQPKKIIFNGPATIVLWEDGTKTVVKCQDGDTFDKEKGIALCFMKKSLGNKSNFNNVIKKYLEE